ncbi:MAG: hypothetical protein IIZ73_08215 [Ruminococcus sp.]|nr:hypothetical protein [Ruminococcus sp.]MCR5143272.1 hypothetical protein [Ruminococcus sp.]
MNDITVHSSDSKPSTAFCVALGGITSALVLLMMFSSTMFPAFDMAIPTFAGFLMVVIIIEAGTKWAVTAYFSCAALSLLMTPDYEAVLLFILFMGYYPILYVYIKKLKPFIIRMAVKLMIFNAAVVVYAMCFKFIFTSVDLLEGMEDFGDMAVPAMMILANVFFLVYDNLLGMLIAMYSRWFRKKILKRRTLK